VIVRGFAAAVAAMLGGAASLGAQVVDSAPPVPAIRHILALDYGRVKPFRRSYEIVLQNADSGTVIGRRDVSLEDIALPDSAAGWLLVESRSGTVASIDSIVLAADLRPVRWRGKIGPATLDLEFTSDSVTGSLRAGNAGGRIAAAVPPDAVGAASVLEVLAPLLTLTPEWSDSVHALAIDFGGASVEPVELQVMAEDSVSAGGPMRSAWILSLRSGAKETRLWVDRENGEVVRAQQLLPSRVGTTLVYRLLPQPATSP
jgi:hypothetical protein